MKRSIFPLFLAATAALGIALAQGRSQDRVERLTKLLNLTDQQQTQARSIFDAARQQSQPIQEQLRDGRKALTDAAKAGKSSTEIDQLAARQGVLSGQLIAIEAKSFSQFYAILTPEQKQKADQMPNLLMGGTPMGPLEGGFGERFRGGRRQ